MNPSQLNRKQFLLSSGMVLSLLIAIEFHLVPGDYEDMISSFLIKSLAPAPLDREGIRRFSREYALRNPRPTWKVYLLYYIQDLPARLIPAHFRNKIKDIQISVHTSYLLSSDYFSSRGGMVAAGQKQEIRKVKYIAFFDPYETACVNPFARFVDSPP